MPSVPPPLAPPGLATPTPSGTRTSTATSTAPPPSAVAHGEASSSSSSGATTTVHDKDKRSATQGKSIVRHRALKVRHSYPGAPQSGNQPKNLEKDFAEAMDDDSQELISDDEMRERMKAQTTEGGGMIDSPDEHPPAPVAEAPQEPQAQAAAMSAEDKLWERMDQSFQRERAFMTHVLDIKLTTVETKLTTEIKNETQKREELAEKVDQQMSQIMDRVKKLEVQDRGATPGAQNELQRNHVIFGCWEDANSNTERLSQVEKLLTLLRANMQGQHLRPWMTRHSGPSMVNLRWVPNLAAASAQFVLAQKLQYNVEVQHAMQKVWVAVKRHPDKVKRPGTRPRTPAGKACSLCAASVIQGVATVCVCGVRGVALRGPLWAKITSTASFRWGFLLRLGELRMTVGSIHLTVRTSGVELLERVLGDILALSARLAGRDDSMIIMGDINKRI